MNPWQWLSRWRSSPDALRDKLETLIAAIDYDFTRFTLESFIVHVAHERQRPLHLVPFALQELSGAVVSTERQDFIFYDQARHPLLQTHVVLHEVGHLLLEHTDSVFIVGDDGLQFFVQQISAQFRVRAQALTANPSPDEVEAELFVHLLQTYILRGKRMRQLLDVDKSMLVPPFSRRYNSKG